MSADFERQKNIQAASITAAITIGLFLLFMLLKQTIPVTVNPVPEEIIEVNLGSGDEGFGTDQPLLPGDPAPAQQVSYSPPQPAPSQEESVRDVSTDDNSPTAPPVIKPAVSKPDAQKINAESKTVKTNTPSTQPVVTQTKPKAVLGRTVGGTGNGGNGADTYKPGGSEGIAGGTGDQGRPGGDPNGKKYTGTPKNFGVQVLNIDPQSFEDEFNRNGKVVMNIVVNENGKVTSATYQPKGSNLNERKYIDIATRSAYQLKIKQTDWGQSGTVTFNFKVKG